MTTRCLLALILVLGAPVTAAEDKSRVAERLFDTSRLVEVCIEIPEKDWRALCSQSRNFAEALGKELGTRPFTDSKGDVVVDGVRIEAVGIRKKGFIGSLDDERSSLKIKFSDYEKKQPIVGVNRLTLNNLKQDDSLSNQCLAYQNFGDDSGRLDRFEAKGDSDSRP